MAAENVVVEERVRKLLGSSPLLLGAVLSELRNGQLQRCSTRFHDQEVELVREFPGLISGILRALDWVALCDGREKAAGSIASITAYDLAHGLPTKHGNEDRPSPKETGRLAHHDNP
jgi:hypothetical protein